MNIHIIDYGTCNLGSIRQAIDKLGFNAKIVSNPKSLHDVDKIVLPGVGSFSQASFELKSKGWFDEIKENVLHRKRCILGICLGMQMFASTGEEGRESEGLGLLEGTVKHLRNIGCVSPVPHVGWNDTQIKKAGCLFKDIPNGIDFYFVHSYCLVPSNSNCISSIVNYDKEFVASVEHENIFGTQFHPEKSSKAGIQILKNFLEL